MKISFKFSLIIFLFVSAILISVVSFYLLQLPNKRLESEMSILQTYIKNLEKERVDLNGLLSKNSLEQNKVFSNSVKQRQSSFTEILNLKALPALSTATRDAVNNLKGQERILNFKISEFEVLLKRLLSESSGINTKSGTLLSFVNEGYLLSTNKGNLLMYYLNRFTLTSSYLDQYYEYSINKINNQIVLMESEIDSNLNTSMLISAVIALISILIVFILTSVIARNITFNIKNMGNAISIFSKGDLTQEFEVTTKDELKILGQDMVNFQKFLIKSLSTLKSISLKNSELEKQLNSVSSDNSISVKNISDFINSINKEFKDLTSSIDSSNNAINIIVNSINNLHQNLIEQSSMVEESTASVTQMTSSISSVTKNTQNNQIVAEKLVDTAKKGGTKLEETTDIITEIQNFINDIKSMADIINNVADQTNLLAMNAAIEAAHAGDAGKGFSVVADEIRKLAETSADNSKKITSTIQNIVTKIEKAVILGGETNVAFIEIDAEVQKVYESLTEVQSSMAEIEVGGNEILKAMSNLQDISTRSYENSNEMADQSELVKKSSETVLRISNEVNDGVDNITEGISIILKSTENLESIGMDIQKIDNDLSTEILKYKTGENNA